MQSELVERARHGDVDAFSALTVGATPKLYSAARLILRDDELASDAVQDALLQAWIDLPQLRDVERFDAWLRRVLVRSCYRAAQRHRTRAVLEIRATLDGLTSAPDAQRATAVRDQLERGFARLSTEQRTLLVLRHYVGLSLQEVADTVGVPLGTAQSRIHRATQAMRAALEADDRAADLATEGVR